MADEVQDRSVELWRETYWATQTAGSEACPAPEEIAALVVGELTGDERILLADHLVACRPCSSRHRDLASLHRSARLEPQVTTATRRAEERRSRAAPVWGVGAAAAAVVLALGLSVMLRSTLPPQLDAVERGAQGIAESVTPANGADLATPPPTLEWSALDGAVSYRVALYDFESTPLWESAAIAGTSVGLPAEVRRLLSAEGTYYWRVSFRVGVDRRQSPLFSFTIGR